jgi:hypothetical protein
VISDFHIASEAPVSVEFKLLGIESFSHAVNWVHALPYGRNSDRSDYMLLYNEKRGTCSTKHAALAALCIENNIHAILRVAICPLHRQRHPGLAPLLDRLGVHSFPEAHCYLHYQGIDLDVTTPDGSLFLEEEVAQEWDIEPDQIGDHKVALHHDYLSRWLQNQRTSYELDEVLQMRERWISSKSNISLNCS